MLASGIDRLRRRLPLDAPQIDDAVQQLLDPGVSAEEKARFLLALADKGETAEEIAAFARNLRARALQPDLDPATRAGALLDVCGTGGDGLHTFNISTTVALLAATAGVPVAKHGNRAITSRSGSADVLDALGVRTDLQPAQAAALLRDHNFAFFFAPHYHPAFKHLAPARRLCADQGRRTLFNFLGPLLNPALPNAQLIGVPQPHLCEPIARVLQSLGVRRGLVVCGQAGHRPDGTAAYLDEWSALGPNHVAEFYHPKGFHTALFEVGDLPLQPATLADLQGGDAQANAQIIRDILQGRDRGPKRDAVLLNTAAALLVADRADDMADGWEMAASFIDGGAAAKKLEDLVRASASLPQAPAQA